MSINWIINKMNKLLIYLWTLKNIKRIMLNEIIWNKELHIIWLHSYEILKEAKYSDKKQISGCLAPGVREDWLQKAQKNFLKWWKIVYLNYGGSYITVYIYQNSLFVYFKLVNFILCKLYLSKTHWKKSGLLLIWDFQK